MTMRDTKNEAAQWKAEPGAALNGFQSIIWQLLLGLLLTIGYVALEWISSSHEYKGLPFTAWDPGLGLLFAALVVRPVLAIPALFTGVIAAEAFVLQTGLGWSQLVASAIIITGVYTAIALVVRNAFRFDPALPRLQDILVLLGGGLAGAMLSAALLLAMLISAGNIVTSEMLPTAWPHIVGDTIGIFVVTPLFLKIVTKFRFLKSFDFKKYLWEAASLVIAITVFAWFATQPQSRENLQYLYLLFIPVVLAAVRHGLTGASVMLALTQAALVFILDWVGTDSTRFTEYQTLMLILTATGLLVGAIVSERDMARQRVQVMEWEAARAARFSLISGMAAALSHEISQPLTAARARARSIERLLDMNDTVRLRENLGPLVSQIDRAADILQHMRDFLRRGSPSRKMESWTKISADAAALLAPLAAEKKVALIIVESSDLPDVFCDRVQIEQVLINLAGNAISALTTSGSGTGEIYLSAKLSGNGRQLEFSVRDNGPGIEPSMAENLFHAMTTTSPEGLGLGIAISVAIIEAHRGRLWLEESRPGHTEFKFHLPIGTRGEF